MEVASPPKERGTKTAKATAMQFPERHGWLQDANSMLVSATCHLTILIILGMITVATTGTGQGDSIIMSLGGSGGDSGAPGDGPLADGAAIVDSSASGTTPDANDLAAALGPANNFENAVPLTTDFAPPDFMPLEVPTAGGAGGVSLDGALEGVGGTANQVKGGVGGKGLGGGGGKDGVSTRASTDFFGIGGYGKSFVYVVDASDSMNDRGKFERARYELLKSIEQLGSEQKYYVIFYNERAYPMDADAPIKGSQENVTKTTGWVNQVQPTGGTNPLPALLLALSLKPDAIYFLSDGQFDPGTIQVLRTENRQNFRKDIRMIPIHTIAFYDRIAEGMMKMIARNSGGEYRYVQ